MLHRKIIEVNAGNLRGIGNPIENLFIFCFQIRHNDMLEVRNAVVNAKGNGTKRVIKRKVDGKLNGDARFNRAEGAFVRQSSTAKNIFHNGTGSFHRMIVSKERKT